MSDKRATIKIPRLLYNKLNKMVDDTGFSSVTEFIVFVMRTIASGGKFDKKGDLTNEEIKMIKKRLRTLGYI